MRQEKTLIVVIRVTVDRLKRALFRVRIAQAKKNHPSNQATPPPFDRSYIEPPEIDETDWEWDEEKRVWYMKDSRETPPEQDR